MCCPLGIEFELKFRANEDLLAEIDRQIEGETKHFSMETTYYDTPSRALSARHFTLRRRQENQLSVCTLKTPAASGARRENEVLCDDIHSALVELCKLSEIPELPRLLTEGIVPICGAKFTRIAKTITLPDCAVELALDRGVLLGGGREQPLCEVEVEHKAGDREAARAYALALAYRFGLQPESASKFHRAKLLAEGKGEQL